MNDIQALFLPIYSITYVTALANGVPDTFATADFLGSRGVAPLIVPVALEYPT